MATKESLERQFCHWQFANDGRFLIRERCGVLRAIMNCTNNVCRTCILLRHCILCLYYTRAARIIGRANDGTRNNQPSKGKRKIWAMCVYRNHLGCQGGKQMAPSVIVRAQKRIMNSAPLFCIFLIQFSILIGQAETPLIELVPESKM